VGLAVAIGIAYFIAARLGLAFRAKPGGVAIFWPAAGVAIGALIVWGPSGRLPIAAAVAVATIISKLLITGSLWLGVTFGLVCAGQTVLTAWLVERWFGRPFKLEDVSQVLGFLVASAAGAAIAAVGAVAAVSLVQSAASSLDVWRLWFASCLLGTVTVAPLLIGLGDAVRELPPRGELIEGAVGVVVLAALSALLIYLPLGPWETVLPVAVIFPVLLWVAVRCRPVFAATGALVVSLAVIWSTTFNVGHFADQSISSADHISATQTLVLAGALLVLVLAALFAERRHREAALKDSNDRLKDSNGRLQLALDCAELGTWSLHLKSGRFENDVRDRHIHGHGPDAQPQTLAQMRSQVDPDDISDLDAAFAGLGRAGGSCRTEYRLAPRTDQERAGRERWVAIEGTVVRDATGQPVHLLGVTRDITERKHAEAKLQESERALRDLLGSLPAAIYVTDAVGRITYCNEGAVNLWGVRPKVGENTWSDLSRFYHADGAPMALKDCPTEIALKQGRTVRGQEAILERADGTRIPIIPYPTPLRDRTGAIVGAVNMTVDISERKQTEQMLAVRNAQLALAGQFALVGTFTFDVNLERMQASPGYVAIHGLPEGTEDISRDDWRAGVHPEDLPCVEASFKQTIADRRREHYCEYRVVRSGGEIRWIDSRSLISYDRNGAARLVGANIDITERKRAEQALTDRNAQFELARKVAKVGSFTYQYAARILQLSPACAAIYGLPEHTLEISQKDWRAMVHSDDLPHIDVISRQALTNQQSELVLEYRIVRPDGEVRWTESRLLISYDSAGRAVQLMGAVIDVTERRQMAQALIERNVQLSLAAKTGLVGSYAYDTDTEIMQISEGYTEIHGFPEGTTEIARNECLAGVHPDDIAGVKLRRSEAFNERQREYKVEYRIVRPNDEIRWVETRCFVSYDAEGNPTRVVGVTIDITERKQAEVHLRALNAELDHRVKNVLATVGAVAAHTLDASQSMDHFVAALHGRLGSLALTHELLSDRGWSGIPLAELLRRELAPYVSDNAALAGPEVKLRAEATQAIGMVLHELVTNAAKYGALSTKAGQVSVRWSLQAKGRSPGLVIEWQEAGGPSVHPQTKAGYGTRVITDLVTYELGGSSDLEMCRDGVRCLLNIPVKWIEPHPSGSVRRPGHGPASIEHAHQNGA
jgi:PAS domain S-box-containing protein